MKKIIVVVILLIVAALLVCLVNWGVHFGSTDMVLHNMRMQTHEINDHVDSRYKNLDAKLDRIESKLDRILKIAERPVPDCSRTAE